MASSKAHRHIHLSALQLALMQVLWRRGTATTADIQAELVQERALAHTTVATLLARLEKRGVVASRRDGRQRVYRARVGEGEVRRSMVAELIGSLFHGDPQALMSHLVRESEMRPGDLERIRALLEHKGDDD
jgi:predicted transcriptional regulator